MQIETQTVSVEEAGRMLGIGRSYAYDLAHSGRLPVVNLGGRRLRVSLPALRRMIENPAPASEGEVRHG